MHNSRKWQATRASSRATVLLPIGAVGRLCTWLPSEQEPASAAPPERLTQTPVRRIPRVSYRQPCRQGRSPSEPRSFQFAIPPAVNIVVLARFPRNAGGNRCELGQVTRSGQRSARSLRSHWPQRDRGLSPDLGGAIEPGHCVGTLIATYFAWTRQQLPVPLAIVRAEEL